MSEESLFTARVLPHVATPGSKCSGLIRLHSKMLCAPSISFDDGDARVVVDCAKVDTGQPLDQRYGRSPQISKAGPGALYSIQKCEQETLKVVKNGRVDR